MMPRRRERPSITEISSVSSLAAASRCTKASKQERTAHSPRSRGEVLVQEGSNEMARARLRHARPEVPRGCEDEEMACEDQIAIVILYSRNNVERTEEDKARDQINKKNMFRGYPSSIPSSSTA